MMCTDRNVWRDNIIHYSVRIDWVANRHTISFDEMMSTPGFGQPEICRAALLPHDNLIMTPFHSNCITTDLQTWSFPTPSRPCSCLGLHSSIWNIKPHINLNIKWCITCLIQSCNLDPCWQLRNQESHNPRQCGVCFRPFGCESPPYWCRNYPTQFMLNFNVSISTPMNGTRR
jgi:hypothetical protein